MRSPYPFQIATIGALFFFFGFVTWTNSILVPYLQIACELSNFQSYFVTFAFYVAYFVMAIPSAHILKITGYKNGISLGLLICAMGTMLFVPAALNRYYLLFLLALYVLGTGLALLQTAANPYITLIGAPEGAASRINIMGTCSSVAGMIAPLIFGFIALDNADNIKVQANELGGAYKEALLGGLSLRVVVPYTILTGVLVGLSMMIKYSNLPEVDKEQDSKEVNNSPDEFWQHKHLVWGVLSIFAYVGVEVLAIDSLVGFASSQGFSLEEAKKFPSICVGAMLAGRFLGIFVLGKTIKPQDALAFNTLVAIGLVFCTQVLSGWPAIVCVMALGLCHSIMWSAIFPLAIDGLGAYAKRGSSFLIMAIVGGALIPPLYGKVADLTDLKTSYLVMLPFYAILLYFGVRGYKRQV
jgi:MFS transporter, FHS family, L-fucose permease